MSAINPLPSSGTSGDKRSYEPSMEEILASIRRIIADDQGLPMRGAPVGDPLSTVESSHELLRMPVPHRPAAPTPADPAPGPATVRAPEPDEPMVPPPAPIAEEEVAPVAHSIAEHWVATHEVAAHEVAAHGPMTAPQYPSPDGRMGEGGVTPARDLSPTPTPTPAPEAAHEPSSPAPAEAFEEPPSLRGPTPSEPVEKEDEMFDEPIAPKPAADPTPLFSATTDAAVSSAFNMLAASRLADNSEELMTIAKEMIRPMLRAWLDDNLPSMVERMVRAEIERVARGGR